MKLNSKLGALGLLVLSLPYTQFTHASDETAAASFALLLTSSVAAHKEQLEQRKIITRDAVQFMAERGVYDSQPSYTLTVAMQNYKILLEHRKIPGASNLTFNDLVDQFLDEVADYQD